MYVSCPSLKINRYCQERTERRKTCHKYGSTIDSYLRDQNTHLRTHESKTTNQKTKPLTPQKNLAPKPLPH